jgi:hypothetical protein
MRLLRGRRRWRVRLLGRRGLRLLRRRRRRRLLLRRLGRLLLLLLFLLLLLLLLFLLRENHRAALAGASRDRRAQRKGREHRSGEQHLVRFGHREVPSGRFGKFEWAQGNHSRPAAACLYHDQIVTKCGIPHSAPMFQWRKASPEANRRAAPAHADQR